SGPGRDGFSDISTKKVGSVQDVSLGEPDGSKTPRTPPRTGNVPPNELTHSGALLRSILKKTPGKQPVHSPQVGQSLTKEFSNSASGTGGGESAAVSSCGKALEPLQTETTESHNSKTPRKKKVTFGEDLSPEIFDEALPPNTPLCRGAAPGWQSPWARPGLTQEPFPALDFGADDEGVEPLQESLEGSVAAEAPSPVENAQGNPKFFVSTKGPQTRNVLPQCRAGPQDSAAAPGPQNEPNTKNPRRNKVQGQRNPTTAAPR
ncbi:CDCA2 protein, partial [Climacteris rufus]|nr:CDCA2 protein [Climacteris rufus]